VCHQHCRFEDVPPDTPVALAHILANPRIGTLLKRLSELGLDTNLVDLVKREGAALFEVEAVSLKRRLPPSFLEGFEWKRERGYVGYDDEDDDGSVVPEVLATLPSGDGVDDDAWTM